ncbi:MAG: type II toxin-antitoxin system RelE/ParE family toxin [Flavobacteriales bacterium]|nr:type II toxin-antitoxin system RelE/ParE family toxin [Flavobacteriales bacterium]
MSYSVKTIPKFEKSLKKLSKKYPSIKLEFTELVKNLKEDPQQGTALGNNCFKIRMSIASKGKGKSGGARVITNFVVTHDTVYLLAIYDKAEKDNLSDAELKLLLQNIPD